MAQLELTWLGVNGFRFRYGGKTLLIDPYFSRDARTPHRPDVVAEFADEWAGADVIVVTHSHWDHIADVPLIAKETGARVVGSVTAANVCRAYGVPDTQLTSVSYERTTVAVFEKVTATFIPSLHAFSGDKVAYAGSFESVPVPPPVKAEEYLEGGTFAALLDFDGYSVLDIGSSNYIASELGSLDVDLFLLSLARRYREREFFEGVLGLVSAKTIIPAHHDDCTGPIGQGASKGLDVEALLDMVREFSPDSEILRPAALRPTTLG